MFVSPVAHDAVILCAFFASMLWQDGVLDDEERHALVLFADQLGFERDDPRLFAWLELPPAADEVDPTSVPVSLAAQVLAVCTLAAGIRPTLLKFEALELLEQLLPVTRPLPHAALAA